MLSGNVTRPLHLAQSACTPVFPRLDKIIASNRDYRVISYGPRQAPRDVPAAHGFALIVLLQPSDTVRYLSNIATLFDAEGTGARSVITVCWDTPLGVEAESPLYRGL